MIRSGIDIPTDLKCAIISVLTRGGVGVLPTDTLYGIVGSALNEESVERIYMLRRRNPDKPMIVLISSIKDLECFDVICDAKTKRMLKTVWPGKISIIFPCVYEKYHYLHRGSKTLAFRIPDCVWLRNLLKKTGPLVAPSANFEGDKPASSIKAAKEYFTDKIDFYVDFGTLRSKPSTLIKFKNGEFEMVRKGAVKIKKL